MMERLRTYLAQCRTVVAIALAYALIVQGFAAPLAHARMMENARLDAAFAVICAEDATSDHGKSGPVHSGIAHDCCLGAQRYALDLPFLPGVAAPAFLPVAALVSFETPREILLPDGNDSPTNISPRGPPSFA